MASAALGASSRLRSSLPTAGPEAERPAADQPPTASGAAREAAEWQDWQDTFHQVDAQERLSEALRVRFAGARVQAGCERTRGIGAVQPTPVDNTCTEALILHAARIRCFSRRSLTWLWPGKTMQLRCGWQMRLARCKTRTPWGP